jgi:hypothetical protein
MAARPTADPPATAEAAAISCRLVTRRHIGTLNRKTIV